MATSGRPASSSRIKASKPQARWENRTKTHGDSGDDVLLVVFFGGGLLRKKATFLVERRKLCWIFCVV